MSTQITMIYVQHAARSASRFKRLVLVCGLRQPPHTPTSGELSSRMKLRRTTVEAYGMNIELLQCEGCLIDGKEGEIRRLVHLLKWKELVG